MANPYPYIDPKLDPVGHKLWRQEEYFDPLPYLLTEMMYFEEDMRIFGPSESPEYKNKYAKIQADAIGFASL